jgi:hypothetical protein
MRSRPIDTPLHARQQLLQYFDQYDREHPGSFGIAAAAIAAVEGLDLHTALQELRMLRQDGQLELVGAPLGSVHSQTQVRITNRGRKAGESAADRSARASVLHYVATHAAERPTAMDAAPHALGLGERETLRALIALAASGLISHQRADSGLGLVQLTPRGRTVTARAAETGTESAAQESGARTADTPRFSGPRARDIAP